LKSRKLIEQLFSQGKNFSIAPYRVFYLHAGPLPVLQAGFGLSGRNFKRAVDRNRIKRLTREAYRLQKQILQDRVIQNNRPLAVFFIYTGKELPDYFFLYEKMGLILQRLINLANEEHSAHT
jgi:ribonuclease P protein component